MTVLLRPGSPLPGTVLDVEARFESESETPVDGVSFELKGVERFTIPQGRSQLTRTHPHVHLRAEHPGATFTPGTHTYHARFQLPRELPPRYSGSYSWVDYTLEVRASIPWWPDAVGRYDVPVAPLPAPAPVTPGVFVSRAGGAVAGELYAELSLASTVIEPGGELVGTVAFTNAAKERGVRVSLVAFEHMFSTGDFWEGGNVDLMREVRRWSFSPAGGRVPEDGVPLPFRFAVAANTVPSYMGAITSLLWVVEVGADRLLSSRPILRAPITIVPPTGRARTQPAAVPAVGRARRAESSKRVAERAGLVYDEEHDCIRGTRGAVGLRIGVETRPDGALVTAANLSWPPLGMRLRLAPASWFDALSSREIEIGHERFDARFHVESRVPDQVRALLDDADLRDLLLGIGDLRADDEGASFAVAAALTDEEPLGKLVASALRAADLFHRAFERVPPPPDLAPHAGAWRAFAERIGGRFEPGRGAILDGTVGLERVEIATQWTDEGQLDATELRVPLGARVDPAAISPAARSIADALEAPQGRRLTITDDALLLRIPALFPDPTELDPVLETLVRLAHAVRGRGAAGPFRS